MEKIEFPPDFAEFLRLLNAHRVEYLLVGGFAVALHGYPRTTADMDIWWRGTGKTQNDLLLAFTTSDSTLPN